LEIRKTGVDGNLDGLSGTLRASERGLGPAKQLVNLRTDVYMKRLNVDPRADATADQLVSIRHIDTLLVVDMAATRGNLGNTHARQISQHLSHDAGMSLIGLSVLV
jgi:hypothetical protein